MNLERRVDDNTVVFRTIDGKEVEYVRKESCDDAVSREAVKELIKSGISTDTYDDIELVCKWIDEIPSVTQKSGKWIEMDGYDGDVYYDCSECGESWTTIEGTPWDNGMKYCPNCGAKMESEDGE